MALKRKSGVFLKVFDQLILILSEDFVLKAIVRVRKLKAYVL